MVFPEQVVLIEEGKKITVHVVLVMVYSSRSSIYGQGAPNMAFKKDPRPLSDKCKYYYYMYSTGIHYVFSSLPTSLYKKTVFSKILIYYYIYNVL